MTPSKSGFTETVLHVFQGGTDGASPYGAVLIDKAGALYGTTAWGGNYYGNSACYSGGCGTVFKLTPSGSTYTKSTIYEFLGPPDGYGPESTLIADNSGALYGTASTGGSGGSNGTVFKLTPSGSAYSESTIYSFQGGADGSTPRSGLYMGKQGALWGTTIYGGGGNCEGGSGCGTIYALVPGKLGYSELILYAFSNQDSGFWPIAGLSVGKNGSVFGTTFYGGGGGCSGGTGCGQVFALTKNPSGLGYTENSLYQFQGSVGGQYPYGMLLSSKGYLYGTLDYGGNQSCDCGGIFRLKQ